MESSKESSLRADSVIEQDYSSESELSSEETTTNDDSDQSSESCEPISSSDEDGTTSEMSQWNLNRLLRLKVGKEFVNQIFGNEINANAYEIVERPTLTVKVFLFLQEYLVIPVIVK